MFFLSAQRFNSINKKHFLWSFIAIFSDEESLLTRITARTAKDNPNISVQFFTNNLKSFLLFITMITFNVYLDIIAC